MFNLYIPSLVLMYLYWLYYFLKELISLIGGFIMTKDSQPDNKKARMEKCNYQTPITEEGLNHNPNRKHKSVKRQGVSSDNFNPAGN